MKEKFVWDKYSDQPYQIADKAYKKQMRSQHRAANVKLVLTNLLIFPLTFLMGLLIKAKRQPSANNSAHYCALCVNLDKGIEQVAMVKELGCRNIQIRLPLSDIDNLSAYVAFAKSFENCHILITLMQDRAHIEDDVLLEQSLSAIFSAFAGTADEFQIGNAINRLKWGFFSIAEYLAFYQKVQRIRDNEFKAVTLVGPSVIDYEYHFTIGALFNGVKLKFDKLSALLYVDRRGAPENTQLKIFDTRRKIDFLYAIAVLSRKSEAKILITEANWPISNTAPWAPTSETECVDEETYANYLLRYFILAISSEKIEKIYWHQLIAPGYGLVDSRQGLRKRSAFYVFKQLLIVLQNSQFVSYKKEGNRFDVRFVNERGYVDIIWLNEQQKRSFSCEQLANNEHSDVVVKNKLGEVIVTNIFLSPSPIYVFTSKT
jgi:hypothetical protein